MKESKTAIFLPGIGYHNDKPLLYYTRMLAQSHGYRVIEISFTGFDRGIKGNAEKMRAAADLAARQTEEFLRGEEIGHNVLFVSKSIGTVAAAVFQKEHGINGRNIFFTPLEDTFRVLAHSGNISNFDSSLNSDHPADSAHPTDSSRSGETDFPPGLSAREKEAAVPVSGIAAHEMVAHEAHEMEAIDPDSSLSAREREITVPVSGIAFHGTGDPWAETEVIKEGCARAGITLYITEEANHSMETRDALRDIHILQEVIGKCEEYLNSIQ